MIYPKQPRAKPPAPYKIDRLKFHYMSESEFQEFVKETEQRWADSAWQEELIPEGFWYSSSESHYPKAEHSDVAHPRKTEILEAYDKLMAEDRFNPYGDASWRSNKNVIGYRGFSVCRCCQKSNGSRQYVYNGYEWPQGYRHYIETHNVVPSKEFLKEVLNIEL